MTPTPTFDPAIADYYQRVPEEQRLEQGSFQLEALRTRELIRRFAPSPPATVLDVGGAAGAYALELAAGGYAVHLVDPVPRLVAEARHRSEVAETPLASCRVGDARALDLAEHTVDTVLLLGPLYHLTDPADRARALAEASRVLRRGGRLFAAAISRWASALDALARDLLQDARFAEIVEAAGDAPIPEIYDALRAEVGLAPLGLTDLTPAPRLDEPWFCCAEPTALQLRAI